MNHSDTSQIKTLKPNQVAVSKWVLQFGGFFSALLVLSAIGIGLYQSQAPRPAEVFIADLASQVAPEDSRDLQQCVNFCNRSESGSQLSIQACTNTCLDTRRQFKLREQLKAEIKQQVNAELEKRGDVEMTPTAKAIGICKQSCEMSQAVRSDMSDFQSINTACQQTCDEVLSTNGSLVQRLNANPSVSQTLNTCLVQCHPTDETTGEVCATQCLNSLPPISIVR